MKKLITIAAFLFAMSNIGVAQTDKNKQTQQAPKTEQVSRQKGKKHKKDFAKNLNLTDAQKQQSKQINVDYKAKMIELSKNENITVKEQRDSKAALATEKKAKFQGLLTAEQKASVEQMKAKKLKQRTQKQSNKLASLQTKLSLSETQVKQLKTQQESAAAQAKSIKENASLSRTDKKEQLKKLRESTTISRKNIFTAQQQKQLETMKTDKKKKRSNKKQK